MSKHYEGDTKTVILVDTLHDITGATKLELRVIKPCNEEVTWTGTLNGTTKIQYITQAADFDEPGKWRLNAYVESPDWTGLGDLATWDVYEAGT